MILEGINWKRNLGCELEQLYIWNKKKCNATEYPETRWEKEKRREKEKNPTRHYLQVVLQISQHRAECDISFQELSTTLIHVHFWRASQP